MSTPSRADTTEATIGWEGMRFVCADYLDATGVSTALALGCRRVTCEDVLACLSTWEAKRDAAGGVAASGEAAES